MLVPFFNLHKIGDSDGNIKEEAFTYFTQLVQQMQQCLGEAFVPPSVTSAQMSTLEQSDSILTGAMVFNTESINGGSSGAPNGQLYIKLADGVFHAIPNL